jgi:hypothetical protein
MYSTFLIYENGQRSELDFAEKWQKLLAGTNVSNPVA